MMMEYYADNRYVSIIRYKLNNKNMSTDSSAFKILRRTINMSIERKYEIGDSAYLKEPYLGYRYVEIVGFEGERLIVRITSGLEFTIYIDELEE